MKSESVSSKLANLLNHVDLQICEMMEERGTARHGTAQFLYTPLL